MWTLRIISERVWGVLRPADYLTWVVFKSHEKVRRTRVTDIWSLTCNCCSQEPAGADRNRHRCSARLCPLPPHHRLKLNPEHINSPRPLPPLFLLPYSSFATNSSSIIQTVFGGRDWANSNRHVVPLQPRIEHMVTTARLPLGSCIRSRFPFSSWEEDYFLQPSV